MEHPLNENAWRRGWQDTAQRWKSVWFIILEAILAPLLGFFVEWWWSIVIVAGGMLSIWIGATARAPIKQRNEARLSLLANKPKIRLENKRELLTAINEIGHRALDVITYQGMLDVQSQDTAKDVIQYTGIQQNRDSALVEFKNAIENIDAEKLIAGEPFREIVGNLDLFLYMQVWGNVKKPQEIGGEGKRIILGAQDFSIALANKISKTVKDIEELAG